MRSNSQLRPVTSVISTQVIVPMENENGSAAPTTATSEEDAEFRFTTREVSEVEISPT